MSAIVMASRFKSSCKNCGAPYAIGQKITLVNETNKVWCPVNGGKCHNLAPVAETPQPQIQPQAAPQAPPQAPAPQPQASPDQAIWEQCEQGKGLEPEMDKYVRAETENIHRINCTVAAQLKKLGMLNYNPAYVGMITKSIIDKLDKRGESQ